MILNNEKQYVTSEKSARYTTMNEISPFQKKLLFINITLVEQMFQSRTVGRV